MKKNIGVITGGTGYIGSHLLKYLLAKNWDLYIITQPNVSYDNINDVRDQITILEYNNDINTLIRFFEKKNPDVVFHLAAAVITNNTQEQSSLLIQSNIQFGVEVLEAMRNSSTRLFINTGSYWQNYNSETYSPVDLYAASKEAFEKIIQYYVEAYQYRAITLRLFDVYGEDDKRPKLLNLLKENSLKGLSLDLSAGEQQLDMVHILDVCSAYLKAYELLSENDSINNEMFGVYTGNRILLKDMILLFDQILEGKLTVNFGARPYRKREVMVPCATYKKLPNWEHSIDLENGLERFK